MGTAVFNPINNATIMSSLSLKSRGFASGMLETTREMGHAVGATVSALVLAMTLPAAIASLTGAQSQAYYVRGFQFAALSVVFVLLGGAVIAYFHKEIRHDSEPGPAPQPSSEPTFQASGYGGNDDD